MEEGAVRGDMLEAGGGIVDAGEDLLPGGGQDWRTSNGGGDWLDWPTRSFKIGGWNIGTGPGGADSFRLSEMFLAIVPTSSLKDVKKVRLNPEASNISSLSSSDMA